MAGDPDRDPEEMCSGNPQAMWDYAEAGSERANVLRRYHGPLSSSFASYRQFASYTLARGHLPDIDASVGHHGIGSLEEDIGNLIFNRELLDGFVDQVGTAFHEADQANPPPDHLVDSDNPDRVVSFTVGQLLEHGTIGYADPVAEQARLDGIDAAQRLGGLLDAHGIDTDDFDPETLDGLDPEDPTYSQIYHLLANAEGSEAYWNGFFNELEADGIHAALGTMDMMGRHQADSGDNLPDWDINGDLREPFITGFANSTGVINRETLDGLADADDLWEVHHLVQLLGSHGRRYDPEFLAASADVLLRTNDDPFSERDDFGDYPPLGSGGGGHVRLKNMARNDRLRNWALTGYGMLAENPEAAFEYANLGENRIEALVRPASPGRGSSRPSAPSQTDLEVAAADAFTAAFVEAPARDERIYHETLELYPTVVDLVGEGDVPDVIKRAVAESTGPYLDDIGNAAYEAMGEPGPDENMIDDYHRTNVVAFFHEIGRDEEAAELLGVQIRNWAGFRLGNTPEVTLSSDSVEGNADIRWAYAALAPVALVVGAAHTSFQEPESDEFNAFAFGLANGTSSATGAWRAFSTFAKAHPLAAAGSYLVNDLGAGIATWMERDHDTVIQVNPTEFRDDLVADLRQGHVALLEDQGVADELIERGLLQPADSYRTEQEYRDSLLTLVYGTEPFADFDGRIVDRAFDRDADQGW